MCIYHRVRHAIASNNYMWNFYFEIFAWWLFFGIKGFLSSAFTGSQRNKSVWRYPVCHCHLELNKLLQFCQVQSLRRWMKIYISDNLVPINIMHRSYPDIWRRTILLCQVEDSDLLGKVTHTFTFIYWTADWNSSEAVWRECSTNSVKLA